MLFDLRGRGRRRAVKVIYSGLGLLMAVGLVGFGIGGGVGGGGILNAASNGEGGGGGNSFANQIKKYDKIVKQQPTNLTAWQKLTEAQVHEAGGEKYLTSNGLTSKGRELFRAASESWSRYIALNPPKPSDKLAKTVLLLYGPGALNEPKKAVEVLQIIVADNPESAAYYSELAEFAYKAHNPRTGDLASSKAVSLAPATDRVRIKKELEEVKKAPEGQTFTTVTNGKTYAVKEAPNGTFTGTQVTSTPAPPTATSTITTKKK
jgi:hypothetical protein